MKILAIRGKDLASLAGRFEVDLATPPLGEAGLFAITGPTGSGKSTLLDALCLALFDCTPRLQGRGRAVGFLQEVDRDVLNSGDPRCLLRRGASSAFAEVDFVGVQGQRWRARWSVRRAHGKSEGRIQPQELDLLNLDTEVRAGGTKRQTLAAIEQALGLDYTGFCRSVLLAQGEFASFLRARPEDRAELLERVTGTELYGKLSIAAHRRAGSERQAETRLADRVGDVQLLDRAARTELEEALVAAEARVAEAGAQAERAQEACRWHSAAEELAEAEAEAEAGFAAAQAEFDALASERAELREYEAARPLFPLLSAVERAEALQAETTAEREAAELALHEAQTRVEATSAEQAEAREALSGAEAAREASGPELERAAQLDESLRAARATLGEREASAAEAERTLTRARAERGALEEELGEARATQAAAEASLAGDPVARALAPSWPRCEPLLRRALALTGPEESGPSLASAEAAQAEAAEEARAAAERRVDCAARAAEASAARAAAEERWGAGRAAAARWPEERAAWEDRRLRLVELAAARSTSREARARAQRARAEEAEALGAGEAAEAAASEAEQAAERCGAALGEAERALRQAEQALDLAGLRHDLSEGEACPLCGAEEHPFARALPPLDALLAQQRERVGALRQEQAQARASAHAETRAARAFTQSAETAARRAAEAVAEAELAEARWAELAWKASWTLGRDAASIGPEGEEGCAEEVDDVLASALSEAEAELTRLAEVVAARQAEGEALSELRARAAEAREACLRAERAEAEAQRAEADAVQRADELRELFAQLERLFAAAAASVRLVRGAGGAGLGRGSPATGAAWQGSALEGEAPSQEAQVVQAVSAEAVSAEAVSAEAVSAEAVRAEAVSAEAASAEAVSAEAVSAEVPAGGAGGVEAGGVGAWARELAAEGAGFLERYQRRVAASERLQAELAAARQVLSESGPRLAVALSRLEAAEEACARAGAAQERAAAELARLERERAQVLGGQAASVVRAEIAAALSEARRALDERTSALREADATCAAAQARVDSAQARAEREVSQLRARQEELHGGLLALAEAEAAELGSLGGSSGRGGQSRSRRKTSRRRRLELESGVQPAPWTADRLREVATREPAWASAAQARRDEGQERLRDAQTTLELRRQARVKHEGSGQPELDVAGAAAEFERAKTARDATERERGELSGRLSADREARGRVRQLRRELEEQRERAELWGRLAGLIGSHDGKRLRVFAQSLTLELLLEHANETLARLAPRYRLGRVEGQDLDLQVVDRTLGDEVRATSSLSGGESFLVSLALALGLSALSGDDTQVESLFVDEGFGSLDPEAQELALATLDALQAEGRQVALISHVPGLADRVGVGVRVVPEGQGRSRVRVYGPAALV